MISFYVEKSKKINLTNILRINRRIKYKSQKLIFFKMLLKIMN